LGTTKVILNGWLSSSSCFLVTTEALLNQKEPKNGKELDGGKAELMAHKQLRNRAKPISGTATEADNAGTNTGQNM